MSALGGDVASLLKLGKAEVRKIDRPVGIKFTCHGAASYLCCFVRCSTNWKATQMDPVTTTARVEQNQQGLHRITLLDLFDGCKRHRNIVNANERNSAHWTLILHEGGVLN
jgi:hypothetical protein